jgi:hypothetical protein
MVIMVNIFNYYYQNNKMSKYIVVQPNGDLKNQSILSIPSGEFIVCEDSNKLYLLDVESLNSACDRNDFNVVKLIINSRSFSQSELKTAFEILCQKLSFECCEFLIKLIDQSSFEPFFLRACMRKSNLNMRIIELLHNSIIDSKKFVIEAFHMAITYHSFELLDWLDTHGYKYVSDRTTRNESPYNYCFVSARVSDEKDIYTKIESIIDWFITHGYVYKSNTTNLEFHVKDFNNFKLVLKIYRTVDQKTLTSQMMCYQLIFDILKHVIHNGPDDLLLIVNEFLTEQLIDVNLLGQYVINNLTDKNYKLLSLLKENNYLFSKGDVTLIETKLKKCGIKNEFVSQEDIKRTSDDECRII